MSKTILITGSTDGIGYETAKLLLAQGHHVLLHGRTEQKLQKALAELSPMGKVDGYIADLTQMDAVKSLAAAVSKDHHSLDVLINNAGVLQVPGPTSIDGIDIRFVVNTIAPYLLTKALMPLLSKNGRVINLASAAQAPVDLDALAGNGSEMEAMEAYSQSKLALMMWTSALADALAGKPPVVIAVNPGSLLASKMVKEGFGIPGKDLSIGANILVQAATSDQFANAAGKYFDNDSGQFALPHPAGRDIARCQKVKKTIEGLVD